MASKTQAYFDQDFLEFFKELAAHNHKEWFDENRKRYEKSVKDPFKNFVADLIENVRKHDPAVNIEAKDAIFRINRDIRFSQDKTPYKLDRSAIVSPAGRKDHSVPGLYISLGPEQVSLGGGAYSLPKEDLEKLRHHIKNHGKEFDKLRNGKAFKGHFGKIEGEENKRLPKEFQEAAETRPILYKKQFYYMAHLPAETLTSPKLMDIAMEHYKAALPLQQFFAEALR